MRAAMPARPMSASSPVEPSYHFIMLDQPARFQAILSEFLVGNIAR